MSLPVGCPRASTLGFFQGAAYPSCHFLLFHQERAVDRRDYEIKFPKHLVGIIKGAVGQYVNLGSHEHSYRCALGVYFLHFLFFLPQSLYVEPVCYSRRGRGGRLLLYIRSREMPPCPPSAVWLTLRRSRLNGRVGLPLGLLPQAAREVPPRAPLQSLRGLHAAQGECSQAQGICRFLPRRKSAPFRCEYPRDPASKPLAAAISLILALWGREPVRF